MHYTVCYEDVRLYNLSRVDKLVVASLSNSQSLVTCASGIFGHCLQNASVSKHCRSNDLIGNNVIVDHTRQLGHVETLKSSSDSLKRLVLGDEDGNVLLVIDVRHHLGSVQTREERLALEGLCRLAEECRRNQEIVGDLDQPSREKNVLFNHRAPGTHATSQSNIAARLLIEEDVLARRDVCIGRVSEKRGLKIRRSGIEASSINCFLQDMILQQCKSLYRIFRVPYFV